MRVGRRLDRHRPRLHAPGRHASAAEFVTRHMQDLAAAAGLPRRRLHDLRHGWASLQLAAGVPLVVVSKRLGHSSIALTSDTCSHLLEGVGRQAAEAAAALVPRVPRQPDRDHDQSMNNPGPETTPGASPQRGNAQVTRVRRQGLEPRTRGLRDRRDAIRSHL